MLEELKVFWFFFLKKNRSSFFEKKEAKKLLLLFALASGMAVSPEGALVTLTTQPGSALEATAKKLVGGDLRQSSREGAPPVLLVGSAALSTHKAPQALFVQVQSASFCGSAGCSSSVYVKQRHGWRKVMDSISGPIRVSPRSHHGMHDLLVHGGDRWVWTGTAYADTLPTPAVDLHNSTKQ
jgi:hypothetical protein